MFYSSVTGFVVFLAAAVAFGFAVALLAGLPVDFGSFVAFGSADALGFGEPAAPAPTVT